MVEQNLYWSISVNNHTHLNSVGTFSNRRGGGFEFIIISVSALSFIAQSRDLSGHPHLLRPEPQFNPKLWISNGKWQPLWTHKLRCNQPNGAWSICVCPDRELTGEGEGLKYSQRLVAPVVRMFVIRKWLCFAIQFLCFELSNSFKVKNKNTIQHLLRNPTLFHFFWGL